MGYQEGDEINVPYHCKSTGPTVYVTDVRDGRVYHEDARGRECDESIAYCNKTNPSKGEPKLNSITKFVKDLALTKEDKALRKVGITNECGELTADGEAVLAKIVFEDYKAELVGLADKKLAEDKAEKSGK